MPSASIQEALKRTADVRLLQLPAKIRNMIYHEIAATAGTIKCLSSYNTHIGSRSHTDIWTAYPMPPTQVLRVYKQVRAQAAAVLYSKNEFILSHIYQPAEFMRTIGANRRHVRPLSISILLFKSNITKLFFRFLRECLSLRQSRLNSEHPPWKHDAECCAHSAADDRMPWIHFAEQSRKDISSAVHLLSRADDVSTGLGKVFKLLIEELGPRIEKLASNRKKRSAVTRLSHGR